MKQVESFPPDRIFIRGNDWLVTRIEDDDVEYVRADSVEALRAELAEKEEEIQRLRGDMDQHLVDHATIVNQLRASQVTVVQDAFKFLEDANETFHVKWSFLTKRYLITIPNLDQEFSGKTLTEALEAARHTEDKTVSKER